MRIFAYREVSEQGYFFTERWQVVKRAHWNIDFIANSLAINQQLRGIFFNECACDATYHESALILYE
jgi:hypothetical protein